MSHEFDRGVMTSSSWHGLEEVGEMPDAAAMVQAGQLSGAWPRSLESEALRTISGLDAHANAIVAHYGMHPSRVLGVVGNRYRSTNPREWSDLVHAAVRAGAQPTGAFSLRDGSRVLATFDVGEGNGLRTQLLLADSFDGSLRLTCGFTTIRVVCANTLAAAFKEDGEDFAMLKHTASLETKIQRLGDNIGIALKAGKRMRETFDRASDTMLSRDAAQAVFDALFPRDDSTVRALSKSETVRHEARIAAANPINRVGEKPGNLATLWNAATYLVDRNADGTARKCRGDADRLDSLLFGSRAERLQQIQYVIEVVLRDGTIQPMTVAEAQTVGIDAGAKVLEDMLADASATQ